MKTFSKLGLPRRIYLKYVRGIREVHLLNYVDFNKNAVKKLLNENLGRSGDGGKHYESVWTRFHQGHYLVTKFGLDKQRAHISTLIASGQISRDEAIEEMSMPSYPIDLLKQDIDFVKKKFDLTREEYEAILTADPVDAREYPNLFPVFEYLLGFRGQIRKMLRPGN